MGDNSFSVNGPKTLRGSLLLVVLAIGLIGYGGYDYVDSTSQVRNSVEVEAAIVETGVETSTSGGRRSRGVDYQPTVTFEYTYQGTSYTSSNVFPGAISPTYDTEGAARDVLADYDAGETATAYLAPDNPGEAFLENRVTNTPLILAGIGLLLALLGGYSALQNV